MVWARADPFKRLVDGQRLAWDVRTQLWRIKGGRHFTPEDHPERLATASNEALGAAAG